MQYSALLTPEGTFVDDCTVYRFEDKVMIVVNAANIDKDWECVVGQKGGANVRLKNISDDVGLLALQGPAAEAVLAPVTDIPLKDLGYYKFTTGKVAGADCFVSRTGYTGEDGFEIYCRSRDTEAIWRALEGPGRAQPIGLGARDSLRLEVAYPLYGNDIDDTTTPLEAGLAWIVKLDKGAPFTGSDALRAQKGRGVTRRFVGFKLLDRGIPRHGYPVYLRRRPGGHRAERGHEPVARHPDRHHLPAGGGRQAGHQVRSRFARHPDPRRGRQPPVLHAGTARKAK